MSKYWCHYSPSLGQPHWAGAEQHAKVETSMAAEDIGDRISVAFDFVRPGTQHPLMVDRGNDASQNQTFVRDPFTLGLRTRLNIVGRALWRYSVHRQPFEETIEAFVMLLVGS